MHTITHNNAQAICDAIRAASVSSSADTYVPILQGVHLRVRGDVLTVTGTDRYRLTRAEDGRKFELADYISDHYVSEHEEYAPIEYDEDNPVATITRED